MRMIPQAHALIGAIRNSRQQILSVVVLDAREGRDSLAWRACNYTTGACQTDWLSDQYSTPEFVFSELAVFHGFLDSTVMEEAIAEFAKIEECGWARLMVPKKHALRPSWRLA